LVLGGVLLGSVLLGFFVDAAAGVFAGLFGSVTILFAWRAGVTARSWSRRLYGSVRDPDYAALIGRYRCRR
jgi:hypothetical protein